MGACLESIITKQGKTIGRLAFGCEQLGGHAWGELDPIEVSFAIREALEKGVTLFDTADIYALGESEARLARAIEGVREKAVLMTKFGVRRTVDGRVFYDCSPEWMEEALTQSLRRLKTDRIDIYLVHYPDQKTPIESVLRSLERKRDQGQILSYGFCNYSRSQMPQISTTEHPGLEFFQTEYSLANRSHEEAIQFANTSLKLTPVFYGCLGQGVLSGKYTAAPDAARDRRGTERYVNFHGKRLEQNLKIVEKLREIALSHQTKPATIALKWVLQRHPAGIALCGIKNREQLKGLLKSFDLNLSTSDILELDRVSQPKEVV